MTDPGPVIGIDLGTWKCCVGVVREGKVEIIENERGSKTTPSYVAFTGTERLVGEDAKHQATVNCENTVFGAKRIIGRSWDDSSLQNDVKTVFPFTVGDDGGKPVIEVTYRDKKKRLFPEQVSAMLLVKMRSIAESHLGCEVRDAVISVPAYFNNAQRQATKEAGAIAGLNVLGLINEPTAAALAYQDNRGPTDETICLVDLGGGSLDVSVIQLGRDRQIQVKKTSGNTSFGGIDFDLCLVRHFLVEYAAKTRQNIDGNKKAVLRLQMACEKLKNTLTLLRSGKIQLDCLVGDTNFESSITQDNFNSVTADLLDKRLITILSKLLHDTKPQIPLQTFSRIILIGGSTRIPKVQQILQRFFNGLPLDQSVNPDEAIAHGAAIYASRLRSGHKGYMQEIYPHTITLTTGENQELPLLAANTPVARREYMSLDDPKLSNQLFFFTETNLVGRDRYHKTDLGVVEATAKDRTKLGLVYGLDKDGLFVVDLMEKCNNQLLYARGSLDNMKKEEKQFEKDEKNEKERLKALNYVEAFCSRNKAKAREMSKELDLRIACEVVMSECDDAMNWFDENSDATKADCKKKLKRLDQKIKILSTLVAKGNYPAEYLTYEGHPYLLDEATSDESSPKEVEDRRPERNSKKKKKSFYSAPTKRTKKRPSLTSLGGPSPLMGVVGPSMGGPGPSMGGPGPSTKDTDSDYSVEEKDAWNKSQPKGKRSRRSSSKAKSGSKFYSVPTRKRKTRSSVKEHFEYNSSEEDSPKGVGSREMDGPPGGKKYQANSKNKNKCTLM